MAMPALVLHHAATCPQAIAVRQKRGDAWTEITWAQYAQRVRNCAAGMLQLGIAPPRHVAILGENSIEWTIAQMATGLIGGCAFGCYPTSSLQDIRHALDLGDAQLIFCESPAFLDKVERVRGQLPKLQKIVLFEGTKGIAGQRDDVLTLSGVEQLGRAALQINPALLDSLIADLSLDKPGLIVFTSGSTGPPKAAMLSYGNMRAAATGFGPLLGFGPEATVLSYLPLCHIAEQAMTNFAPLHFRTAVAFGGGLPTLLDDLRHIRPTYFSGVPRVWLRLQAQIVSEFARSGKADALAAALAAGSPVAFKPRSEWNEAELDAIRAHEPLMAEARALVGLDRIGVATSGAASLSVEVLTFFRSLGVNLLELYGMTEACSIMTLHHPDRVMPGTVGEPIPSVALKLAEDGEVLVKGGGVFAGYYRNPEATAATIADGWLYTGDVGRLEGGQLRIIDRKKDIMITDGGKNISPAEIEALMRTSVVIQECVLVADGRKFVTALIQIDPAGLTAPATACDYTAIAIDPATQVVLGQEIQRLNQALPRVSQIKRAYILPQPLQHEQGELTPTLKLRRFMVHQRYAKEIESLYAGATGFDIAPDPA